MTSHQKRYIDKIVRGYEKRLADAILQAAYWREKYSMAEDVLIKHGRDYKDVSKEIERLFDDIEYWQDVCLRVSGKLPFK